MNREDLPKRSLSRSPRAVDHPTWPQTAQRRSPAARCEAICGPGIRLLAYPCLVRFWYVLNVIRTVPVAQLMGYALLHPINVRRVSHEQTAARFVDRAALIWFFHGPIFHLPVDLYLPVDLPGMVF